MHSDDTSIAFDRFLIWLARSRSGKQPDAIAEKVKPSAGIAFCLFLIYYFTLCDFILKFFPIEIAIVLRYLPEAALYLFALALLIKQWRVVSFPLFWPLCACALTMAVSVALNSSSKYAAIGDFRLFFRFVAFAYIGWRTTATPQRIRQFLKGFLGLAIIELAIGGLELVGGEAAQNFFTPVLGLISGAPVGASNQIFGESGWIFGTLSNYNFFGMFMTTSCVLALGLYLIIRSARYLWLSLACALAAVLSFSRHSLLLLAVALGSIFILRSKRISMGRIMRVFMGSLALVVVLIALGERFDKAFEERIATITSPDELMAGDIETNARLFMALDLTPRFLSNYPFFGQGPIAPSEAMQFGENDPTQGPQLKAAPDAPGIVTYFLGDVVWVMILGLYGCFGLAAFGYVLWTIASAANRVRKRNPSPEGLVLAQICIVTVIIFVLSGFFSEEIVARDCIPVFWLISGMVFSLASEPQSERTKRRIVT